MKVQATAGGVLVLVGVAVAGFVAWQVYSRAGKLADSVAETAKGVVTKDLNPASSDNIVNRGVSAVGEAITGESGWSLGGWLYDITHPGWSDPNAKPAPAGTGAAVAYEQRGNASTGSGGVDPFDFSGWANTSFAQGAGFDGFGTLPPNP